jgi:hypothetical protein
MKNQEFIKLTNKHEELCFAMARRKLTEEEEILLVEIEKKIEEIC